MSKPKKAQTEGKPRQTELENQPEPAAPEPAQPTEQLKQDALTLMATQLEEMRAEFKKTTLTLAEAIVKINEKVDAKAGGGGGSGDALTAVLSQVLRQPTAMPIEDFAKQAEAIAKAADAIDRFRIKPNIGAGEAYLMRLGLRAGYPRYMTKHELARMEKAMGIIGAFEEEEGGGHVTE